MTPAPAVRRVATAALVAALAGPAAACPLAPTDGTVLAGDGVHLAWRLETGVWPVAGEPFVLVVRVCPASAELTAVDATMPAHRHGMNYRPSLAPLGPRTDGRWRVEGLLWHMSGRWELALTLRHAGTAQTLRQTVDLP